MKLSSLSIFIPFYNDEGTVFEMIEKSYKVGNQVSNNLEVIAIHGGNSKDNTYKEILRAQKSFPKLKIIDKSDNKEGYAVIKYGFLNSKNDWIFYTDGDAQYDLEELKNLVNNYYLTKADVINGYKTSRGDGVIRHILGDLYAKFSTFIFELPIRDTDCDFRLIKKDFLDKFELVSTDSSILGELIKKLELSGAKFSEVPVSHFDRKYGSSNYTAFGLFKEKLLGDIKLYFKLRSLGGFESKLRIVKFSGVGLISVLIQVTLFNLIILFTSIKPFWATIIADQFAILNSFLLNNRFTFKDRKYSNFFPKLKPFFKFYLIVSITTLLQATIVYLGNLTFGYNYLISNIFFLIGIILGFVLNYSFQKRLVWK
jgi:putative flippase GtrA